MNKNYNYRVLNSEGLIKFTGTNLGSWFTLEKARELRDNGDFGDTVFEYDNNGNQLWETF